MAMTKAEKAQLELLEQQLRIAKAFRFTDFVDTDVKPPERSEIRTGWLFNAYIRTVDVACTSSVNHSYGRNDKTDTQRPAALYSTRLLALRAMRHAVENTFATQLAEIDEQIEAEQAKPKS